MPKIGDPVTFVDQFGQAHSALVTAIHGETDTSSLNVVYVDQEETKRDQYGRQIARATSVVHESHQSAHGMKWR